MILARRWRHTRSEKPTKSALWIRLLTLTVAALVLAGTATIGIVIVGTQIGFYRHHMGIQIVNFAPLPLPAIDLAVFTPLATEGVVWMCTLMAVVLVLLNRPAGIWTRSMWFFAAIAAFVNAARAIWMDGDLLGGIATGGLSIAGPYTVHLFVVWVRHLRTGRTVDQARIDTEIRWAVWGARLKRAFLGGLDVFVHPHVFIRTVHVWRTFRGLPWAQAWFIASKRSRARVIDRYRNAGAQNAADVFMTALDDTDVLDRTVHAWSHEVLGTRTHSPTSMNTSVNRQREHSPTIVRQPQPELVNTRTPTPVNTGSTASVNGGQTKQDTVIGEYWRRRAHGEQVTDVNISELARTLFDDPNARPTVSRVWNACLRGEHPEPNGRISDDRT